MDSVDTVKSSTINPCKLTAVDLLLLRCLSLGHSCAGLMASPQTMQREHSPPMQTNVHLQPTALSKESSTGASRKVPTPVPQTQIPMAKALLLLIMNVLDFCTHFTFEALKGKYKFLEKFRSESSIIKWCKTQPLNLFFAPP